MNLVKNEKLENNSHELQFSIDAEAFNAAIAKAFKREAGKYNIPGFRKGKAPSAYDREDVSVPGVRSTDDAINDLVHPAGVRGRRGRERASSRWTAPSVAIAAGRAAADGVVLKADRHRQARDVTVGELQGH